MGIHFSLQHGFDEALGEGTDGLGEGFGAQRAARCSKLGNVLVDMVIEGVGGLLTRIAFGIRVHWMHPIGGLRLSHGHKISDALFCLQHDLGTVVIGHNDGWKQNVNLGKVNNQNFVSIPFNRLIHMIRYKAEEYGIKVIVREESYTSRQSALDFDPLPNYGDKNANQVLSTGRRVRGLFFRSNGQVINSDVNGCLNIGRKEFGDDWLKKLVETDKGCLMQPVTVRIGQ